MPPLPFSISIIRGIDWDNGRVTEQIWSKLGTDGEIRGAQGLSWRFVDIIKHERACNTRVRPDLTNGADFIWRLGAG